MSTLGFTLSRHEVILRQPFVTSLRSVDRYPVISYTISDESEIRGVGECVATPVIIGDSLGQIEQDLKGRISPALANVSELEEGLAILATLEIAPSSKAAADMALHSYFAARLNLTLCSQLGSRAVRIKTDVTIPIASFNELDLIVQDRIDQGFSSLKVKLRAVALSENIAIMQKIKALIGPQVSLRVDPNQAWEFQYAKEFLIALNELDISIDYLEQPVGRDRINDLARLSALDLAPIMADESLFSMSDLEMIIESKACTWINVKILKSGGIAPARAIANVALASGLNVSIGSMMEGAQGVRAAAILASVIAPNLTHDLDAAWWHEDCAIEYSGGELEL
jgi:L-Ala-D/L-Glu epimerase